MLNYCLSYSTDNIGDDIQMLAARQHYPHVDAYVDRDRLSWDLPAMAPGRIILNAWYMHPKFLSAAWPPPPHIKGLCVSMHVFKDFRVRFAFSSKRSKEYLLRHAPVGARDEATKNYFESLGIPSYVSGCMTMTFRSKGYKKDGPVVFCDAWGHDRSWRYYRPDEYLPKIQHLPLDFSSAQHVTHFAPPGMPWEQRVKKAEELLDLYDRASLVITSRLHCALPSIAMGTPVIFFGEKQNDPRYTHWHDVLKLRSREAFANGDVSGEVHELPKGLADNLRSACSNFFKEESTS